MTKPTWILESNVFAEVCFDVMLSHLQEQGFPHHVVRIIPFVHEIEGKTPKIEGPCIVYGSIGVQKLAAKHGWTPGVFPVPTEVEAMAALGDLYLNSDAVRMPISEVREWLTRCMVCDADATSDADVDPCVGRFEHKAPPSVFFIKPDTDTKEFAGQTIDSDKFSSWYEGMVDSGYLDGNDFPVVISTPKKLGCEWRVVVVDGKIVTSSLYRQYQMVKAERNIIPEVEATVLSAHARFQPADAYVIDVAQVGDEYKIIEYNTLNSAGLYECDPRAVIDAVSAFVESR